MLVPNFFTLPVCAGLTYPHGHEAADWRLQYRLLGYLDGIDGRIARGC
jgi:hypothetical protein